MSQIRNEAVGLQAGALALLTSVLWGGNPVAIKMGLDGVPPAAMAGLRFALGALTVWVGALFAGIPLRVPASEWKGLGGLALLFALQIWLLNAGTGYTTASRSAVVINVYPFFTALFAHLLVGDRLGLGKWLGFAFSFAGVLLLFWESVSFAETGYLLGDAMVAASGLLLGLRQVVIKRLVQGLNPYQVLFWQAILSLPLFAAWSVFFEAEAEYVFSGAVIAGVLYQGIVVAGLCFIVLVFLLRHYSPSRLAVFSFITPIVGVLLSTWLLGDGLSPYLLASVALVVVGIVVANQVKRVQGQGA
ncbi:MAG: DMT family transporter [Candidatus Latescibacterota bacterium]|nr:DMT family transporter [Candidatus Latescibacterota bacterium]